MNDEQEVITEAEFLGCLIKDHELMDTYNGKLDKHDFIHPTHFKIWDAMTNLYRDNIRISLRSVYEMNKDIELDYLKQVSGHVFSPALANRYFDQLMLNSAYRKMHAYASKLIGIVHDREKETPSELLAEADNLLTRLRRKETSSMIRVSEMRDSFEKFLKSKSVMIKTGRKAYDDYYGGIPRKALYILAGRTHVGKTAEALQMAHNMSKMREGEVLFWSQEMTREDVLERMASNISGVNYKRITNKETNDLEHHRVMQAFDEIASYPLSIDDTPRVKIHSVRATANMFKRKYGKLAALFIDYLSMMDVDQKSNQTFAKALGEVAFDAKALAKELDCPVIILAQINRQGAETDRPASHHLKESGDIEQAADFIEILWRNDEHQTPGIGYEVITSTMTKGRKGGLSEFYYKFTGSVQRYEDYRLPQLDNIKMDDEGHITNHSKRGKRRA